MDPLELIGHLRMLVLVVAFPDRAQEWPVIKNDNSHHPKLGAFPDGTLLSDYIADHGPVPVEAWYGTALSHFFNVSSGGMYTAHALYPKKPDGKPYTTEHPFQYWIDKNGSDTGVVWRYWRKMVNEAANAIFRMDSTVFKDIDLLQVNFTGIKPTEYHKIYRGQAIPGRVRFYLEDSTKRIIYNGQVAMLYKSGKLVHEALHLIGKVCGSPGGFSGLPDRGTSFYDKHLRVNHFNATAGYDVMYNMAHLKAQHSLYEQAPLLSHDLIQLGWINQQEILEMNQKDTTNVKLADINYCLTDKQKQQGFYRIAKIMIHENFDNDLDEYFLLEFHNASQFDRNFHNYDEGPYNTGMLIWHIYERTNRIDINSDNFIDLETAVPYNGWNGKPVPQDDYPRGYERPAGWNGSLAGDYDWLDDMQLKRKNGGPALFAYLPDGGRYLLELTVEPDFDYTWDYTNSKRFYRGASLRSDFFSDRVVRGYTADKFTPYTRPSSKDWAGESTGIAVLNIKQFEDHMTFDVRYDSSMRE
jgi:hypothetical protein